MMATPNLPIALFAVVATTVAADRAQAQACGADNQAPVADCQPWFLQPVDSECNWTLDNDTLAGNFSDPDGDALQCTSMPESGHGLGVRPVIMWCGDECGNDAAHYCEPLIVPRDVDPPEVNIGTREFWFELGDAANQRWHYLPDLCDITWRDNCTQYSSVLTCIFEVESSDPDEAIDGPVGAYRSPGVWTDWHHFIVDLTSENARPRTYTFTWKAMDEFMQRRLDTCQLHIVGPGAGPTCDDGARNGDEEGVDCGGSCPAPCPVPTCDDGKHNQGEDATDCGGPCPACETCDDGLQNQGEEAVDCGGPCAACETCDDGILNQGEDGTDCGGPCAACPTCDDGAQNGDEAGVDCGGSCPLPCGPAEPMTFTGRVDQNQGMEAFGSAYPLDADVINTDFWLLPAGPCVSLGGAVVTAFERFTTPAARENSMSAQGASIDFPNVDALLGGDIGDLGVRIADFRLLDVVFRPLPGSNTAEIRDYDNGTVTFTLRGRPVLHVGGLTAQIVIDYADRFDCADDIFQALISEAPIGEVNRVDNLDAAENALADALLADFVRGTFNLEVLATDQRAIQGGGEGQALFDISDGRVWY